MKQLATFMGKSGDKLAVIYQIEKYVLPYKVEYYDNEELMGNMFYISEEEAELAAKRFTFGG